MMQDGLDVPSVRRAFPTFISLPPRTWMLSLFIVFIELSQSAHPASANLGPFPSAASLRLTQDVGTQSVIPAIERIRQGTHAKMPQPEQTRATGPVGDGLTVENGTGTTLTVYFRGPTVAAVQVEPGGSKGVALLVGNYEAAAELKDDSVIPHYGTLSLAPNTHYWLRFYVAGSVPLLQEATRSDDRAITLSASIDVVHATVGRAEAIALPRFISAIPMEGCFYRDSGLFFYSRSGTLYEILLTPRFKGTIKVATSPTGRSQVLLGSATDGIRIGDLIEPIITRQGEPIRLGAPLIVTDDGSQRTNLSGDFKGFESLTWPKLDPNLFIYVDTTGRVYSAKLCSDSLRGEWKPALFVGECGP